MRLAAIGVTDPYEPGRCHVVAADRNRQRVAVAPSSAPPCTPGLLPDRVDSYLAHQGEIDHQAGVGHGKPERAVPAAPNADLEVKVAGRAHRRHHVLGHALLGPAKLFGT